MIEFWLFIVLSLQFYVYVTPAFLYLKPRRFRKHGSEYAHYWGLAVWAISSAYFKNIVFVANETTVIRTFLMFTGLFLYLCIFYEGSFRKKLVLLGVLFLNAYLVEVLSLLLIMVAFPSMLQNFDMHTVEGIWVYALMTPIFPLVAILEYRLFFGRFRMQKLKQLVFACIFPLFAIFQHPIQDVYFWANQKAAVFQVPAMLFLVAVGIYWLLWLAANTRAEEEKRELREIHMIMAEHQIQYRKLEERSEEVAKLRHDYRNQLSAIRGLIEEDPDQAERMVEELVKQLKTS